MADGDSEYKKIIFDVPKLRGLIRGLIWKFIFVNRV